MGQGGQDLGLAKSPDWTGPGRVVGSSADHMYVQLREQKAVDKILETAEISEVDVTAKKSE